jgi:hypothetical protein
MITETDRKIAVYLMARGRDLPRYLSTFSLKDRLLALDSLAMYCAEASMPLPADFLAVLAGDPAHVTDGLDETRKEIFHAILDAVGLMAKKIIAGWGGNFDPAVDMQNLLGKTEAVKGQKDPVSKAIYN